MIPDFRSCPNLHFVLWTRNQRQRGRLQCRRHLPETGRRERKNKIILTIFLEVVDVIKPFLEEIYISPILKRLKLFLLMTEPAQNGKNIFLKQIFTLKLLIAFKKVAFYDIWSGQIIISDCHNKVSNFYRKRYFQNRRSLSLTLGNWNSHFQITWIQLIISSLKWAKPGLFCLYSFLSHDKYSTNTISDKKHRWCAWNSNPGRQDGKHRKIHWARYGGTPS